ncbi:hypothetical protein [Geobacter sp.]|nr:hypothetical protein [Geobacter sp.]
MKNAHVTAPNSSTRILVLDEGNAKSPYPKYCMVPIFRLYIN